MLTANPVMIASGCGIISIPIEKQRSFMQLLIPFYETNDIDAIKSYIYRECIDGMDFEPMQIPDDSQVTEEPEGTNGFMQMM